jgi:hypothetical protein
MRIALFHNTPSGGAKRAIFEWVRRLSDRHSVDVFSMSTADHEFCDLRPYTEKHKVYPFSPNLLFTSPLGRLNQLQRWRDLGTLTCIGKVIAEEINTGKYEVFFANSCVYTHIPALLQFVKIPSIYFLHEPFGRMFKRKIQRPYMKEQNWRKIINRFGWRIIAEEGYGFLN